VARGARWHGAAVVFIVHDETNIPARFVDDPDLVVYVAQHLAEARPSRGRSLVVHPVIEETHFRVEPGRLITAINLNEAKGGPVFFELAKQLPDHPFLGVRSYGRQEIPAVVPRNVELQGSTDDMRNVYSRTRVLLMPSTHPEGCPQVPLEAAISGIPAIAHPIAGTREALGAAAFWADRGDLSAWVRALRALDDPVTWAKASAAARARWIEHAVEVELEIAELERALAEIARR
jgi:glycosyltransferase involved in cell wall biosynthesis